jgi:PiT family inorganic phosphate transporter
MGLIMLILIGAAPTAYALNRTLPDKGMPAFIEAAQKAEGVFTKHATGPAPVSVDAARETVSTALRTRKLDDPAVYGALAALSVDVQNQVKSYGAISHVPAAQVPNMRNDMFLAADAASALVKGKSALSADEKKTVKGFEGKLEAGTRFIPVWVKISVALALGLGTMVGWKRIVVTVGEKIGKTHLTYAQGAAAEIVAAFTIATADTLALPVSTTHILSSGVAGTMAANGSGLQMKTLGSIASAWVLTLPAAMALAGGLYFILRHISG